MQNGRKSAGSSQSSNFSQSQFKVLMTMQMRLKLDDPAVFNHLPILAMQPADKAHTRSNASHSSGAAIVGQTNSPCASSRAT